MRIRREETQPRVLHLEFQPTSDEAEDLDILERLSSRYQDEYGVLDLAAIRRALDLVEERLDLLQKYTLDETGRLNRVVPPAT
jgi:hypothetical protein